MEYKLDTTAVLYTAAVPESGVQAPLAMAYAPMQQWGCVYEDAVALTRGTIFPPLDKANLIRGILPAPI